MGMFDYVNVEINCPECGAVIDGFQSKSGECYLTTLNPQEVTNFYSSCECGAWVEFFRKPEKPKKKRKTPYNLEEVLEMGFEMRVNDD